MKNSNFSKESLEEERIRKSISRFFDNVIVVDVITETDKKNNESCKSSCRLFKETGECICKKAISRDKSISRFVRVDDFDTLCCCSVFRNLNGKKSVIFCEKVIDESFEITGNKNKNEQLKTICLTNSSAYKDSLTKLNNRKYVDDNIKFIAENCKSENKLFSVIAIDIDKFKQYNDEFGHEIGDRVLITLANILRDSDDVKSGKLIPIRTGGDEFIVIGNGAFNNEVMKYANRVLRGIEKSKVDTGRGYKSVSISIGIADSSKYKTYEYGALYRHADEKLYEAKENGRNNIVY